MISKSSNHFQFFFFSNFQIVLMPELPDIEVFAKNLDRVFANKKLLKVKVVNGKKLPDTAKALSTALEGKVVKRIYRSGKEFRFQFSEGVLLGLHLMLTGDLFLFEDRNDHHSTIVELYFEVKTNLALTDRMRNAWIRLDPVGRAGKDALDLDFDELKNIFNRRTSIKNVLLDQDLIRGIGNGYSDEILWEARISPYSIASAIPDKKIKELVRIIPKVLLEATKKIDAAYPGKINDEVKEFLIIHRKVDALSPTGRPILIDTKGSRKTYYTDEQVLYE
jgi:formamidopyrimidine-DNA glycosylase